MKLYKEKKSKKAPIITIVLLCGLIVFSRSNNFVTNTGINIINSVVTPINKVVYFVSSKIVESFEEVVGSREMREENQQLTVQNQILQEKVTQLESVIANEEFLKAEYKLKNSTKYKLTSAYITGKDPGNLFVRFSIDKGSNDGVKVGDIIVQGNVYEEDTVIESVIGFVSEVGFNWAKVSTIANEGNNISFMSARTRDYGIIDSYNELGFHGYLLESKADIKVGDKLLTSGLGGVYPRDLLIGEVLSVKMSDDDLLKEVTVYSPVDFSKIYRVFVLDRTEGIYE